MMHNKTAVVEAPLEAGQDMYPDLQEHYHSPLQVQTLAFCTVLLLMVACACKAWLSDCDMMCNM